MEEDKIYLKVNSETDKILVLSVYLKKGEIEVEKDKLISEDQEYFDELDKKIYEIIDPS